MCEKEKLFLELVEGFQWKYDLEQYPNYLFAFKDDIFIFEIYNSESINPKKIISCYRFEIKQDLKNADIWINYDKIWSIFESKFEMKHDDIQFFMKDMVEKHFKIRVNITQKKFMSAIAVVEKHFKMELFKTF